MSTLSLSMPPSFELAVLSSGSGRAAAMPSPSECEFDFEAGKKIESGETLTSKQVVVVEEETITSKQLLAKLTECVQVQQSSTGTESNNIDEHVSGRGRGYGHSGCAIWYINDAYVLRREREMNITTVLESVLDFLLDSSSCFEDDFASTVGDVIIELIGGGSVLDFAKSPHYEVSLRTVGALHRRAGYTSDALRSCIAHLAGDAAHLLLILSATHDEEEDSTTESICNQIVALHKELRKDGDDREDDDDDGSGSGGDTLSSYQNILLPFVFQSCEIVQGKVALRMRLWLRQMFHQEKSSCVLRKKWHR